MWNRFSRGVSGILGALVLVGLILSGCAIRPAQGPPPPRSPLEPEPAFPDTEGPEKPMEPSPRALTSLRFTDQARRCLEARKPDEAIRVLERAVNLDPHNGRNYYFLAEAWLMKGDAGQAREFNRLADIYLAGENSSWGDRIQNQKEKIDETH